LEEANSKGNGIKPAPNALLVGVLMADPATNSTPAFLSLEQGKTSRLNN
jgi:hypothetical protein